MTEYKFNRNYKPNIVSLWILGITVGVTVVDMMWERIPADDAIIDRFPIYLPELWNGAWWQLVTCSLVHGSAFHIFMNGYALWVIGKVFEQPVGHREFLFIYVMSVIGGAIGVALLGDVEVSVVGASGGIFGLFGALLAFMYSRIGSLRGLWNVPFSRHLVILLGINVFISFTPGISALGHFGGLIVGALMGYLFERKQSGRLLAGEKIGAAVLLLAVAAGTVYSVMPMHRSSYWLMKAHDAATESDWARAEEYLDRIGTYRTRSEYLVAQEKYTRIAVSEHQPDLLLPLRLDLKKLKAFERGESK